MLNSQKRWAKLCFKRPLLTQLQSFGLGIVYILRFFNSAKQSRRAGKSSRSNVVTTVLCVKKSIKWSILMSHWTLKGLGKLIAAKSATTQIAILLSEKKFLRFNIITQKVCIEHGNLVDFVWSHFTWGPRLQKMRFDSVSPDLGLSWKVKCLSKVWSSPVNVVESNFLAISLFLIIKICVAIVDFNNWKSHCIFPCEWSSFLFASKMKCPEFYAFSGFKNDSLKHIYFKDGCLPHCWIISFVTLSRIM